MAPSTHRIFVLALALGLLTPLAACGPKKPLLSSAAAVQEAAIAPVYFRYGGVDLTDAQELLRIGEVVQRLKSDDRLVVVLVGSTDATGAQAANLKLSQARAESVRQVVLKAGGIDERRVISHGVGELPAASPSPDHRRVEFVFARAKVDAVPPVATLLAEHSPPATTAPEAGSSAAATPNSGSKAAAPSEKGGDRDRVIPTGLADVDSFFTKVQALLDSVQGAQDGIRDANVRLRTVLGIGTDAKLGDALADLKESAKGAVKVKMENGKPKVTVEPGASPKVTEAVGALNGLVAALGKATQALAAVPQQAQVLIGEAKALPGKIPTLAKDAGLGIAGMGGALKAVKHNVGLTVSIPKECGAVGKEAVDTFKAIGGAFG